MRNLKKMLSVLLVIAMVAISMVPAFAADTSYTYDAQAKALHDVGLFNGVSPDSFVPDLGSDVTREQGIAIVVRLLGKNDAAAALTEADADAALAAYTDAKDIEASLKNAVAYAVKNGLVLGATTTTIEPKGAMTGNQLATILLRNLGYTVDAAGSETAAATLTEKGGLTAAEATKFATKNLIRDDLVGIAYGSLQAKDSTGTKVIDKLIADKVVDQAKAEAAGIVAPAPATATAMTAKFTGAKEVTVTFDGAVADTSKAAFTVKKDTSTNVDVTAKFADDKKSATLALGTKVKDGSYTITAAGVTDKDLTATLTGTDEKVSKITFSSDKAVIGAAANTYNDSAVIYVYFKIVNQYGEDVTSTYATDADTDYNVSGYEYENDSTSLKDGKLIIYTKDAKDKDATGKFNGDDTFTYGENVPVSITYVNDDIAVTASQVFTVSTKAGISDIGITKLYTDETKDLNVNSNFPSYYLLFDLKDQLGNVLSFDSDEDTIKDDLIVSSSNPNVVEFTKDGDNYRFTKITVDGSDKIALGLENDDNNRAGTAIVTVISKTTGKMAQYSVTVKEGTYAASFSIQQPDVVVLGEKAIIPFEAYDAEGNAVTDYDDLTGSDNPIDLDVSGSLTAANYDETTEEHTSKNLYFEEDNVTGKAQLVLDTISLASTLSDSQKESLYDQSFTITAITPNTYKTSNITFKIKEDKKPDSITSVASTYVKKMVVGGTAEFGFGNFTVKDQYGRAYTTSELKYQTLHEDNYAIKISSENTSNIVVLGGAASPVATETNSRLFTNTDKIYFYAPGDGSSTITVNVVKLTKDASGNITAYTDNNIDTTFAMTAVKESEITDYAVSAITTPAFDTGLYTDANEDLQLKTSADPKYTNGPTAVSKNGNYNSSATAWDYDSIFDKSVVVTGKTSDGSSVWLSQQIVTPIKSGDTVTGYTYKDAYTIKSAYSSNVRVVPDTKITVPTSLNSVATNYKLKFNVDGDMTAVYNSVYNIPAKTLLSDTDADAKTVPFVVSVNLENKKMINGQSFTVDGDLPMVTTLTLVHNNFAILSSDKANLEVKKSDIQSTNFKDFNGNVITESNVQGRIYEIICEGIKAVDQYGSEQGSENSNPDFYSFSYTNKVGSELWKTGDKIDVTVFTKSGAVSLRFFITVK